MITLPELEADKARLLKQRDNAAAVFNQVCGAIMQTDALIARAREAEQKTATLHDIAERVAKPPPEPGHIPSDYGKAGQ